MGTWGTAVTSDDTVNDVTAFMIDCLKAGNSLSEASDKALLHFRESLDDADDGPLIWLGIALTQWKYGMVNETVLRHVRENINSELGLDRWREDPAQLGKRIDVLSRFLTKISEPNQKPATIPKIVSRPAPFAPGDCVSVLTSDLRYTAAIILAVDNSNIEHGANLVGSLDYLSDIPPTPEIFEKRKWLCKHHGNWKGERELSWFGPAGLKKEQRRFAIVCQTKIRFFDTKKANSFNAWANLGKQILLCHATNEH